MADGHDQHLSRDASGLAQGTTVATLWRSAGGRLSAPLASAAALQRAERAMAAVPPELSVHQLLFECDPARDRLDFALVGDASTGVWASRVPFAAALERIARHAEWATGDSARGAAIAREVWLEFDVAGAPSDMTAPPAGFFGLTRELAADRTAVARLAALLASDGDRSVAERQWRDWRAAYERELAPLLALQPREAVRYLGRMDSRGARSVRYHLGPVTAEMIRRWRPLPAEAELAIARADWLVLGFDLEPSGIDARWGVELVFRPATRYLGRWRPVVDALVDAGILKPDTPDAIAAWTGATCETEAPDAWLPALLGGPGGIYHVRTLNHIKLVFAPGVPATAKVYLANDRQWLQPGVSEPA